jgi:PAS domain-containing protein
MARPLIEARTGGRARIKPAQWLAFVAIAVIGLALIALIWMFTSRAIADQAAELRARADQQVRSTAFVLAREVGDELRLIDQSLAIIQDSWAKDADSVDLGQWRQKLFALTDVANDIFIANDQGVIVQGTLPRSIGQGFGSAYVTYPNGSLEIFDAEGTKNPDGKTQAATGKIEARQFLTYIVRPLKSPPGWWLGASYRSEAITKLFSGADLGQEGIVGLVAIKRGGLQAIVGASAQFGEMDIARSDLVEQMRKNDGGVWTGVSPMDRIPRVIAYQRVPGRDLGVIAGIPLETALRPLAGLAVTARAVAFMGSLIVVVLAGLVIRNIAGNRARRHRERVLQRLEMDLVNARQEVAQARARVLLTEPEVGALMSSPTDGVARLDSGQRLRRWNPRFAELAGVQMDTLPAGTPVEDLFRRQAEAGLFGEEPEQAVSARLTILDSTTHAIAPLTQRGPGGETISLHVRGVADGGQLIVLVGPENAALASLPVLTGEEEVESADETTHW